MTKMCKYDCFYMDFTSDFHCVNRRLISFCLLAIDNLPTQDYDSRNSVCTCT